MNVDIDKLSKEELLELNKRIITRLKYLSERVTLEFSKKFRVGDVVEFRNEEAMTRGIVIRINRKTLSIKTKEGQWNIPPQFIEIVRKNERGNRLEIVK